MRTEEKTNISINLVINEAPGRHNAIEEGPESRHVLLNLDAVVINEPKEEEQFETPSTLETLEKIDKLFITKSAEPWLQKYVVETPCHNVIYEGTSTEETCPCGDKVWMRKSINLLNSHKISLLRITFGSRDYLPGSHERSFTLLIPSPNPGPPDDNEEEEWTRFGCVKLQEVAGCYYVNSLFNTLDTIHLSGRIKPPNSLKIISDSGETVAIIDLHRTARLFQFISSYMLTFTKKDLSFHSKALVVAAIICYDVGFHRRQESIKCILQYVFWFSFLLASACLLFLLLVWTS